MEMDVSKDVRLTDEEKRILADIERYEEELRTRLPWKRLRAPERPRRDLRGWGAIVLGTAVLVAALVANVGLLPFAGFVILLAGVTRVSSRISFAGWRRWLRDVRTNLSAPRSGDDGT
jgi:hypothetical protein